jgi:polar amino acid transport system substrate-binding protein
LTEEELQRIIAGYDGSRLLMVGFNRRFSPLAEEVKKSLSGRRTPLVMSYRVNAGYIPNDSWVHDPKIGGGRLVGEACHFIDFMHFMAESEPVQVSATSISGRLGKYRHDDNLSITLTFQDGSLGNILYTAKGTKSFPRERFEVFCEDSAAVIEDFRQAQIVQGGRVRRLKKFSMDMGYQAQMEFFFHAGEKLPNYGNLFTSYVISSLATLEAANALKNGGTQRVIPTGWEAGKF